jgi:hypothetical protein
MKIAFKLSLPVVVFGSLIGATLCFASSPRPLMTIGAGSIEASVNRASKSDRLERAIGHQSSPLTALQHSDGSFARRPVGCDPAFSPLAEPARKHLFGRCVS